MIDNTYSSYWNYVHLLSDLAYDLDKLKELVITQKNVADSTILAHTAQAKYTTPDVALYLDVLTLKEF